VFNTDAMQDVVRPLLGLWRRYSVLHSDIQTSVCEAAARTAVSINDGKLSLALNIRTYMSYRIVAATHAIKSSIYLDMRGRTWQEAGGDCITRSFITCTNY
jgi:hypothetical protein